MRLRSSSGSQRQGAHVVQLVRELDEDDADVAGHREEHLADGLGRLEGLVLGLERGHAGRFLHQEGRRRTETLDQLVVG